MKTESTQNQGADANAITPELDALLEKMYSSMSDSDWAIASVSLNIPSIIDARRRYLQSPTDENKQAYIAALEKLYQAHYADVSNSRNPYSAPAYAADGILTPREAAQLTAKFQQRNTRGDGTPRTLENSYQAAIARIERLLPRVPTSQMAGGKWKQQSAAEMAEAIFNAFHEAAKRQRYGSARPAEDKVRAKLLALKALKNMTFNSNALYVSIRDESTGDVIRAYINPRTSMNNPKVKASPAELKLASDSLAKIRENSNVEHSLTLSLVAASSILPTNERIRKHSSRVLGYAFAGGGAHVYVDRVAASGAERAKGLRNDAGWWSTNVTNLQETYMHVGVHEVGHVVMYKVWGNDSQANRGESALELDYRKYNVRDRISEYGKESVAEHFAEAFAKYVITGEATPEFRALLESKGLLKSQKKS